MNSKIPGLRLETGAGIMDCKQALEEAGGDFEKAKIIITKKGLMKAAKKEKRAAGVGLIDSYIHAGRVGVLLEMRCETDFVARADDFKVLVREIAMQITAMNPENIEALINQPFIKNETETIGDLMGRAVAKLGENIQVARFCRYEV